MRLIFLAIFTLIMAGCRGEGLLRENKKNKTTTQTNGWRRPGSSPVAPSDHMTIRTLRATTKGINVYLPPRTGFSFYPESGKQIVVRFSNRKECETVWIDNNVQLITKDNPETPCGFGNSSGWMNIRSKIGEVVVRVVTGPLPRP